MLLRQLHMLARRRRLERVRIDFEQYVARRAPEAERLVRRAVVRRQQHQAMRHAARLVGEPGQHRIEHGGERRPRRPAADVEPEADRPLVAPDHRAPAQGHAVERRSRRRRRRIGTQFGRIQIDHGVSRCKVSWGTQIGGRPPRPRRARPHPPLTRKSADWPKS
ncbi:MAG: hypothetical protein MUC86_17265 [Burkholderiaceae bacterium]|nr:hypothetical protein [Burkholderiaceae bacterium]